MHSPEAPRHRACLVGVRLPDITDDECEDSLAELKRLVHTLGHDTAFTLVQARPSLTGATVLGAGKLRELVRLGGPSVEGPWDGEEAITLLADLDAGATGSMTGGAYPDGIRRIVDAYAKGDRESAVAEYGRWLPLINYENRQCGLLAAKALMQAGGVIECEAARHPFPALPPAAREGLLEAARRLDPLVLRWNA